MCRLLSCRSALGGVLLLSWASMVQAADDHAATGDPLEIRFDTAFWAVLVFVTLLLILRKTAWGPILEGLQKREEMIRGSLEEAKKTRSDMEQMRLDFKKEIDAAHQQIPALMEVARRKGDEVVAQKLADATAKIQADQDRFRREMEIAKDQAIKDLWDQAAQLASLISAKAIGRSLNADDHRRLIAESLQEIAKTHN